MPCDTRLKARQSISQRAAEVRRATEVLDRKLLKKQVRPVVGPQGAITFQGWTEEDRDGITDACAYRRIMASGSALAKMEIARAEMLAGRKVDRLVVGQGVHSHDGGASWHSKG